MKKNNKINGINTSSAQCLLIFDGKFILDFHEQSRYTSVESNRDSDQEVDRGKRMKEGRRAEGWKGGGGGKGRKQLKSSRREKRKSYRKKNVEKSAEDRVREKKTQGKGYNNQNNKKRIHRIK